MKLQINCGELESTPTIEQRIIDKVERVLQRVADRITRVEVHVRDDNRGKSGPDVSGS